MTLEQKKGAVTGAVITGVCVLILCYVIYIFLNKDASYTVAFLASDAPLGVGITCFINCTIQVLSQKGNVKKGKVKSELDPDAQAAYVCKPRNPWLFILVQAVIAYFIFGLGFVGLFYAFAPEAVFGRWVYIFIKALMTALGSVPAVFHANLYLPAYFTKKFAK